MLRSDIRLGSVRRQDLIKEEMKGIMNNFIFITFTRNREGEQIQEHEISRSSSKQGRDEKHRDWLGDVSLLSRSILKIF